MTQRCIRTDTGRWVETDDGLQPLPGSHHPATADYADEVRSAAVLDVEVPEVVYQGTGPYDALVEKVVFSQRKACHADRWGAWVWRVWEDNHGRRIASNQMEWIPWWETLAGHTKPEFARAPLVRMRLKAAAR